MLAAVLVTSQEKTSEHQDNIKKERGRREERRRKVVRGEREERSNRSNPTGALDPAISELCYHKSKIKKKIKIVSSFKID